MAKSLVIVESPAKAKTIAKILGKDFTVKASSGHVRDLPKKGLGVEVKKRFAPQYVVLEEKERVVKELQEAAAEVKEIYLAPDPDREGEAIAWHLSVLLEASGARMRRIEFNEITKDAILKAVKHPRAIDINRVNAQQARRVLDRLVGYKISPLLWQKVKRGLSAGRVQSVACRIVCDRESVIDAFVPQEYWSIGAELLKGKISFVAGLSKWDGKKFESSDKATTDAITTALEKATYKVAKIQTKEQKRRPSAPFTTSSLQQEASRRHGYAVKRTMAIAQQLYEGLDLGPAGPVGLITYMRTDSVRIANEAQEEAKEFIAERYGREYPEKRVYASKKGAQEAHEAIRPSSIVRTPESIKKFLTADQFKIYKLIWERFCSSQMADAKLSVTTAEIAAAKGIFRASDTKVMFPGYQAAYQETAEEDAAPEEEPQVKLPDLKEGDNLDFVKLLPKQHFTQPPPRFTEATLVRTLEEQGIGRPSTYAPTIATIMDRGYVEKDGKSLKPTDLGKGVNGQLVEHFPNIVDVTFTSTMELSLDSVEEGKTGWVDLIEEFYEPFAKTLKEAESKMQAISLPSDEICVKCAKPMFIKSGRFGDYLACEDYPAPCKTTKPIVKTLGMICKKESCEGDIIIKRTRTGKTFFGCNKYPACNWTSWDEPTAVICVKCNTYMVKKFSRAKGRPFLLCSNVECKNIQNMPSQRKKDAAGGDDAAEAEEETLQEA